MEDPTASSLPLPRLQPRKEVSGLEPSVRPTETGLDNSYLLGTYQMWMAPPDVVSQTACIPKDRLNPVDNPAILHRIPVICKGKVKVRPSQVRHSHNPSTGPVRPGVSQNSRSTRSV